MAATADLPDPPLRIDAGPDGELRLAGELDLASTPALRSALQQQLDAGRPRCVLDLAGLTFCDSTGLTVLLWAEQTFPDGLRLHHPSPQLRKLLHATGLQRILTLD